MRSDLDSEADDLVQRLALLAAERGWTPAQVASAVERAIADELQRTMDLTPAGQEPAFTDVGEVTSLTLLRAAEAVQKAAAAQVEYLMGQAKEEGFSWAKVGNAIGISAPAALQRWQRAEERAQVMSSPLDDPAPLRLTAEERGWFTAATMGRMIGKDQRTVKAMGERGELVTMREGKRTYYREAPVTGPDVGGDFFPDDD